jgi:hypothetical protein
VAALRFLLSRSDSLELRDKINRGEYATIGEELAPAAPFYYSLVLKINKNKKTKKLR